MIPIQHIELSILSGSILQIRFGYRFHNPTWLGCEGTIKTKLKSDKDRYSTFPSSFDHNFMGCNSIGRTIQLL